MKKLTLTRLAAWVLFINTIQAPAATDELISWLLYFY
jgi:hypothetical protein